MEVIMTPEGRYQQMKAAVSQLSQFYDNVLILGTVRMDGTLSSTDLHSCGSGDVFAQIGAADAWVRRTRKNELEYEDEFYEELDDE